MINSHLTVKDIPVDRLIPNPKNPRIDLAPGMPMYDKLRASIIEGGYAEPIIWNQRTGYIVGGHQRLQVMKDIASESGTSLDTVSCVVVDLDEVQQNKLMIGINKIDGVWDRGKLSSLFDDLQGNDMSATGFDDKEIERLIADIDNNVDDTESEFKKFDETMETKHKCPKCGYEWN